MALERKIDDPFRVCDIYPRLKSIHALITVWKIEVKTVVVNRGLLVHLALRVKVSWLQYFV